MAAIEDKEDSLKGDLVKNTLNKELNNFLKKKNF